MKKHNKTLLGKAGPKMPMYKSNQVQDSKVNSYGAFPTRTFGSTQQSSFDKSFSH